MRDIAHYMTTRMPSTLRIAGGLWLTGEDGMQMTDRRIDLLEQIGTCGSITQAARQVGLSYKGAWDNLEAMRNALGVPLLVTESGGKGGGGSRLTEEAKRIVQLYRVMQREHANFLRTLSLEAGEAANGFQLLRKLNMKTSARNQYYGTVAAIQSGPVNAEVVIALNGGEQLVAVVTHESVTSLGLKVGSEVWALVKATWVIITPERQDMRLSARNSLRGTVSRITRGQVNSDVVLALGGGLTISAVVTAESLDEMGLKEGDRACAVFKATSVILAASV